MKKNEDKIVLQMIEKVVKEIYEKAIKKKKPELNIPIRNLGNVKYDERKGYFELGKEKKRRTLSVNTVKAFAQTLKMLELSKKLVETEDVATKRDVYYQSKNWQDAKFLEQPESDTIMDDIEAMFSDYGISRSSLKFIANDHGGLVSGNIVVVDELCETKNGMKKVEEIHIDCRKMGSGAYSIPPWVEHLKFKTDAEFILMIECAGVFNRLQSHKFYDKANCILVSMSGVPSRACRRFIRRLVDIKKIPCYCYTDSDPYGFSLYRVFKCGSGASAAINKFYCVPTSHYLGLMPSDLDRFHIRDCAHKLTEINIKRAKDLLKNDPFFASQKEWQKEIELMIKMGVRAEQQALSKHGLNFVMDTYLPEKLAHPEKFLP